MLTTAEALQTLLAAADAPRGAKGGGADTEISAASAVHPAIETLPTEVALGRVLAADIVSPIDVPPMDVSAMDGYAVRLAELAVHLGAAAGDHADVTPLGHPFPVSQRIPAGASPTPLASGTVARIFTGAPVPEHADLIVIQEDAQVESTGVRFTQDDVPRAGQWINRRGADIRAGAVILPRGTRLTPQALGLAASVGVASLPVIRRLKVAMLFTGDELRRPGEALAPGAIYNSNRYTLGGMLQALGCDVTDIGIVADRLDATRAALRDAAASHDLVLTSGGVSVGEEDHVKAAVEAEGTLALWKIAMKPGKPLAFGTLKSAVGSAFFIGLPGNPVSTFVTFLLFVRPFILRLQGVPNVAPKALQVRADFALKGDRRNEFLRVRLNDAGGLDLYPSQSSAVLTSTVWGDGLVDNPPGRDIAPGDLVRYLPFTDLLF
ncbi:gephyrin-like molybdotransferase Glp [Robbsia sp. KACC 23696]|uniref:molybdopterin molybdotransferase MoeA n=1 Tax=Robbsia sp. KACC 23696 TaxID=3149231 RepID=UPI00325AB9B7